MAAMRNTMPKIEIDKDWCLRRALLEGDSEVGAGPLSAGGQGRTKADEYPLPRPAHKHHIGAPCQDDLRTKK
jgi:hypothetical protein